MYVLGGCQLAGGNGARCSLAEKVQTVPHGALRARALGRGRTHALRPRRRGGDGRAGLLLLLAPATAIRPALLPVPPGAARLADPPESWSAHCPAAAALALVQQRLARERMRACTLCT